MRILHVHSGNLFGGVETMLRTMARSRALVPGHEPVFALTHDDRIARELRGAGCEVHLLGAVRARQPWSVFRAHHRLAALAHDGNFDASVVHSAWSLALLAPAAPRPLILWQHDTFHAPRWNGLWSRRPRPDLVVANSSYTAATIGGAYPAAPIRTIHPCIELSPAEIAAMQRHSNPQTVILQAARFESWKGHSLLLEALATLRRNPNWILWIAGAAQRPQELDLRRELHALSRRLAIADRVRFLGHVTGMPALMRFADIYCQPNTAPEPFGLTFVEALNAQLPVVATALGGAREILNPDCGILAAPTVDAVSQALQSLLDSPALRLQLGAAGPLRARQLCDPRAQIQKLEQAISSLTRKQAAA